VASIVEERRGDDPFRVVDHLSVEPPPGRRVRVPELLVGTALMLFFSLAAVLWHLRDTEKTAALALANPMRRGEVVEAGDLRVVYVSAGDAIAHLDRTQAASVGGRVAVADLPAGTLLTAASVSPRLSVAPGEGVVGLALEPGQVPAGELVPGDVVNVVAGPASASVDSSGRESTLLASLAEVYAVEDLGVQGRKVVSLKLPVADANRVAAAAERGPLRLVLVGR
jgi:hypothetical protein